jgi:hypothetical protein
MRRASTEADARAITLGARFISALSFIGVG